MNAEDLTNIKKKWGYTNAQMAVLLGISKTTYDGYITRNRVPVAMQHSITAHNTLSSYERDELLSQYLSPGISFF